MKLPKAAALVMMLWDITAAKPPLFALVMD